MKTEKLEYLSVGKLLGIISDMRKIIADEKGFTEEQVLEQPVLFMHDEETELLLIHAGTAIHEKHGRSMTFNMIIHPSETMRLLMRHHGNEEIDKKDIN